MTRTASQAPLAANLPGDCIDETYSCPSAQATTYLATAPKSNGSGAAYWAAVADVRRAARCRPRCTCATRAIAR